MKSLRSLAVPTLAALLALSALTPLFAQGGGREPSGPGRGDVPAPSGPRSEGGEAPSPGPSGPGQDYQGTRVEPEGSSAGGARFSSWFDTSKEGRVLASVREALMGLVTRAMKAGVPYEAFIARIKEAVAKGASPDTVVKALSEDAARWIWIAGLLDGSSWPPASVAPGFYVATASALRNGVDEASVRALVLWARDSGAGAEKAGAALTAAAAVSTALRSGSGGLGAGDSGGAALLLVRSRLRVGQYQAVADMARRAAAAGVGADRFMAALGATLGTGGSLADLERALFG